jgi:hypothetical protein
MFALYRFSVSYIALMVAQFIWLIDIEPMTTYQVISSGTSEELSNIGDFNLTFGRPWPFSEIGVWNYLLDTTQLFEIPPSDCSPFLDLGCRSYVLFGVNRGYSVSRSEYPVDNAVGIGYDIPCYIVEFQSTNVSYGQEYSWAHNLNHTSANVSIQMHMDLELEPMPDNTGWNITAAWSLFSSYMGISFESTNMSIYKTKATVISDIKTTIIVDVLDIGERVPYAVNLTDFFAAFTSPLTYSPVDISNLIEAETMGYPYHNEPIFLDGSNSPPGKSEYVADAYVEGIWYSFFQEEPPYALQLQSFLAHALVTNSYYFNDTLQYGIASQQSILSISLVSIGIFASLVSAVLLVSMAMLALYPRNLSPNVCLYAEVAFGGKLGDEFLQLLGGLGNATNGMLIERFSDVEIKVGEQVDDQGNQRIFISTTKVSPLCRNVAYL